jgi:CDP-diacylglycerol--serine O-phosphatidyltransferase
MRWAVEGNEHNAVIAIVIAAILDSVDGRVARLLKGTSHFGTELDSLADFVNFGVAPAFVLYLFSLKTLQGIGWIVVLIFSMSVALRLARFNVAAHTPDQPSWKKRFFVGVPAPAAALIVLLPVYIHILASNTPLETSFALSDRFIATLSAFYTIIVALLVISRIPTFSGKNVDPVAREHVIPLIIAAVVWIALLVNFTFLVLAAGSIAYLCCIPMWKRWHQQFVKNQDNSLE